MNRWMRLLVTLAAGSVYILLALAVCWFMNYTIGGAVKLGFAGGPSIGWTTFGMLLIGTPIVAVVVASSLTPAHVPPAHLCRQCGYDLTGNVSGVCPECGRPTHRKFAPPGGACNRPADPSSRT